MLTMKHPTPQTLIFDTPYFSKDEFKQTNKHYQYYLEPKYQTLSLEYGMIP